MPRYAKRQGKSHNKGWQVSALDNMCWRKKNPPQASELGADLYVCVIRLLMRDDAGAIAVRAVIAQAWINGYRAAGAFESRTDAFC